MSTFAFSFEGNLAAAPELSITPGGHTVCKLRVAHNRRRKNADGQWVDTTPMWVSVTTWGDLAERCAQLDKGDTVVVDARDDLGVWAFQRQDGTPGGVLEVTAANVAVSMRFAGATVVPDDKPAGDAWDPTAEQEHEEQRELEPSF
jgi:single-strand DNA-binding protein